jgi:hypothetical protein
LRSAFFKIWFYLLNKMSISQILKTWVLNDRFDKNHGLVSWKIVGIGSKGVKSQLIMVFLFQTSSLNIFLALR